VTEAGKDTMEACGYTQDPLDGMLYTSGDYFATPVCTVDRRNQGAFHPEFNPLGTGYFAQDGNPAIDDRRFEIGNSAQLLSDNNDFTAWTASSGVVVSGGEITGADGEEETIVYTMGPTIVLDSTRYVFFVDLSKASGDETERVVQLGLSVQDDLDADLVVVTKEFTLTEDTQTCAISVETPSADTDHIILHLGNGNTCDFTFVAANARFSEDTVGAPARIDVQATSTSAGTFTVTGDQRDEFPVGWDVILNGTESGSDSNDGSRLVTGSVFDGANTVFTVSPGFTYNTGNTGQVESALWHYVASCYENISEGDGGLSTGGILSGVSGRFDGRYHDEIDADSVVDMRIFLEAHGGSRATLSIPTISGLGSSYNEEDVLTFSISNYSAEYTYHYGVTDGVLEHSEGNVTWTMPTVDSGYVTLTFTVHVTNDEGEYSEIASQDVRAYHVPIVEDDAVYEALFSAGDFTELEDAEVDGDGYLVGTVDGTPGRGTTLSYEQEEGDSGWAMSKLSLEATPVEGRVDIAVDTGLTTTSSLVGDIAHGVWSDASTGDKLGLTSGGISKIVELLSASIVEGGDLVAGLEVVFRTSSQ